MGEFFGPFSRSAFLVSVKRVYFFQNANVLNFDRFRWLGQCPKENETFLLMSSLNDVQCTLCTRMFFWYQVLIIVLGSLVLSEYSASTRKILKWYWDHTDSSIDLHITYRCAKLPRPPTVQENIQVDIVPGHLRPQCHLLPRTFVCIHICRTSAEAALLNIIKSPNSYRNKFSKIIISLIPISCLQ